MTMKRKTIHLFFALLIGSATFAQADRKAYMDKIKEICPTADIIQIDMKEDYVEVDYLCDGTLHESGLDINKNIIFTEIETDIPLETLEIIEKKLDKKYAGWVIDEFALVKTADTTFYKAEVIKSAVEENVYFTLDGKYYKSKNIVANEPWMISSLSGTEKMTAAPYNFLNPDRTFDMPEVLKEISGIAFDDRATLYCVQDETGIVFQYNIEKEELSGMLRFTDVGDFEDIALRNDTAYVLRSDGTLFYFNYKRFDGKIKQQVVPLSSMNMEGLFYDPSEQAFYLASKDALITDNEDNRTISRVTVNQFSKPVTAQTIGQQEIISAVTQAFPSFSGKKLQFNPSAIAIHPITKEKYVLSASNRLMAVYDSKGLRHIYPLPAELYYKPEGIAFASNGDLFISSEGMKNGYIGGQVYFFKYRLT